MRRLGLDDEEDDDDRDKADREIDPEACPPCNFAVGLRGKRISGS